MGKNILFLLLIVLEQVYTYHYIHNFGMTTAKLIHVGVCTLQFTSWVERNLSHCCSSMSMR